MDYRNKRISLLSVAIFGMLFTFPLKDAFAYTIKDVPFRLSEIWIVISLFFIFFVSAWKLKYKESGILWIVLFNLLVTLLGVVLNKETIVFSFAIKYIARNMLWLMVLVFFLGSRFEITSQNIDMLMKYTAWVQAIACIFTVITNRYFYLSDLLFAGDRYDANFISIAGHVFHRLKGTCSEPGYLAPLLAMMLYYFLMKYLDEYNTQRDNIKYMTYIFVLFVISLFSFSSAVYGIDLIIICYVLITSRQRVNKCLVILLGMAALLVAFVIVLSSRAMSQALFDNVINKVSYYIFRQDNASFNFSAVDRSQHVEFAKKIISESTISELILGKGTGAYYFKSLLRTDFYQNNVSEANNIYLSSMTDRGILGVAGVIATFIYCKKMLHKDIYSRTLFCGIIAQGLHWILVGNFWLYGFWYEILFLIGYKRHIAVLNENYDS
ncbi:hypothetical protein [Butyrivibrio sp. AC2005]|uniref:hypothetical protein n=1 Tax=Butyrivibrio sp. AC2005 TaxID=1280672 RepID=UPI0003FF8703|nr:hypothetical protein [Butyrivibrio sp. AC2005]